MGDYTFTIGTHDPTGWSAATDREAIQHAIGFAELHHAEDLRQHPEAVVTLMGAGGLLTRPSERLDEFVARETGTNPEASPDTLQPGDTNAPDCNGD